MTSSKELYEALPASRNLMIEHHMNMAYAVARSWSRERRRLKDDMEGQALLGLVKGCHSLIEKKAAYEQDSTLRNFVDYESYLYTMCRGEIQHLLQVERDHRGETLADYDSRIQSEEYVLREDEMWEDVTYSCTKQERHILTMFLTGHTVEAIGEAFSMSRAWAQAQLTNIRIKVKDRL